MVGDNSVDYYWYDTQVNMVYDVYWFLRMIVMGNI